ncbi:triacylglycerol lipase OBL1-like [Cryptomeria japonica]|uniref:triacylglycerol lipase OBL1-like n=1 Tax=Cryptomeria japonica TaxID=3369 RepID=UPI0027D9FE26|nr:triacylglycerol lipase OBL1-like [Cryptomeria japonica]
MNEVKPSPIHKIDSNLKPSSSPDVHVVLDTKYEDEKGSDHLQKKSTQAFVLCDKEIDVKLILVAFRGTQLFDADDYITDLDFSWYEYPQIGKVHLGFLEGFDLANRSIDKKYSHHLETQDINKPLAYFVLCQKLKNLLQIHKNAKFIVTGHSIGGALAILFLAMLFVNQEDKLLQKLLAIYTFGQPRVGDKAFVDFMDSKLNQPSPRYFRVVYSNDLIPRLPFDDGLFKYKHFGVCLYYNCFYHQKNLVEAPNRDLSLLFFILIRITTIWELLHCFILHYIKGESFKETTLSIISRIFGILVPGISAHSLVNYINSIRLGPPRLNPTLSNAK